MNARTQRASRSMSVGEATLSDRLQTAIRFCYEPFTLLHLSAFKWAKNLRAALRPESSRNSSRKGNVMKITIRTSARSFREIAALLMAIGALLASLILVGAEQAGQQPKRPKYPDISQGQGSTRGGEATEKLAPELRILFGQYNQTRGGDRQQVKFNQEQLRTLFGIQDPSSSNPTVNVAVRLTSNGTIDELKRNGAKVYLRDGDMVLARTSVLSLERIARS